MERFIDTCKDYRNVDMERRQFDDPTKPNKVLCHMIKLKFEKCAVGVKPKTTVVEDKGVILFNNSPYSIIPTLFNKLFK